MKAHLSVPLHGAPRRGSCCRLPIVAAAALRAAFTLAVGLSAHVGHPAWLLLRENHGTTVVIGNGLLLVGGLLCWRRMRDARFVVALLPWWAVALAVAVTQGTVSEAPGLRVVDALTQLAVVVLLTRGQPAALRATVNTLASAGFLAWGFYLVAGLYGATLGGLCGFLIQAAAAMRTHHPVR